MDQVNIEELVKQRSVAKAALTKRLNSLKRYVAEDNSLLVEEKFKELKDAFVHFEKIHDLYQSKLNEDKDITESEIYFDEVEKNYISVMFEAKTYIKSTPKSSVSSTSNSTQLKLPPAPQPEIFYGSPQHYPMWKASFSTLIDRQELGLSGEQKMFYLQKFTSGEASRAIQSLFLVPSIESYNSAVQILHERFGNSALVASAFRERLEKWPKINERDSKALLTLSDFLQQIVVASATYSSLKILDDEFENRKLVTKLPSWLAAKWIERVVMCENFPPFCDFANFIKDRASIANHSLWGDKTVSHPSTSNNLKQRSNTVLLTSNNNQSSVGSHTHRRAISCPLCNGSHRINACDKFKSQNLNERKNTIMTNRLCFGCLNPGHQNSQCRSKQQCSICKKFHPTLLHDFSKDEKGKKDVLSQINSYATNRLANNNNVYTTSILPVKLSHGNHSIVCYALLDSQSNSHFISDKVKQSLCLVGTSSKVELSTMLGKELADVETVENITLSSLHNNAQFCLQRCFVKSNIPCSKDNIPNQRIVERWQHLKNIALPQCEEIEIGLLLGFTCHEAFKPLELALGGPGEPYGIRTPLGWCIMGPSTIVPNSASLNSQSQGSVVLRTLCKEIFVENHNNLPLLDETGPSVEDRKFLKILEAGFHQDEKGNYVAPLPLRNNINLLPNNKAAAYQRLKGLSTKLRKNPSLYEKYSKVMEENISNGYAERVPDKDLKVNNAWYVPHHGVPKGKDKVRVVFDCSANYGGMSLNDCLLPGPNLLNTLLGILLRFRLNPTAFLCDIENMYYNFYVTDQHKDFLRFLWWPEGDMSRDPVEYRMKVHIFGAVSSGGVASFGLRQIVQDFGSDFPDSVKDFICKDFYVDDGCVSVKSDSEALSLLRKTQSLLSHGNLKVHKVVSNSQALLDSLPDSDKASPTESDSHKVLGVEWNTVSDELMIPLSCKAVVTKRSILSQVASIYDPIGFVSPLLIDARLLLQTINDHPWDGALPVDVVQNFSKWCGTLKEMDKVRVQRHIQPNFKISFIETHYFSDASTTAYAACCYVRFLGVDGKISVSFVIGKCKVVPMKPVLTIPRLELMACVLSTQLATVVRRELPWKSSEFFWTDSNVALGYIRNTTARFKVFVANRVQTIHDRTDVKCWFHIGTKENPADDGSRGKQTERWLNGPSFLLESGLPLELGVPESLPDVICADTKVEEVIEPKCFRSWFSTKKVYAWVLRFINNCKPKSHKLVGDLSLSELVSSETCLFRLVQGNYFAKEISLISKGKAISSNSPLIRLDCFLDKDKVLRVGGRLKHSSISLHEIHPVVLPPKSEVTSSIVDHYHRKVKHQGRGMIISEIRSSGFWIVKLASLVKSLIQRCVTCQRLRGRPAEQKMSDLPPDRFSTEPAFTNVGCDCFGPFTVKSGRSSVKRYGLIFTCLASRAVHLEMCYSLTSDSFLNAFKRFVSIRGPVNLLRCDRGTNFVGASKDLLKMGCQLEFNPPDSSHRGGVWERMIGVSRRVLEGILIEHGGQLDDESLLTVLHETASIVNSRPLCVVGSDPLDLIPLSANQLLTMKSKVVTSPPVCTDVKADLYAIKRWKRVQYLAGLFWSRWKKEFLVQYHQRSKWNKVRENLKVGDIVLVVDDQVHRSFWKMARVLDVKASRDNLVRSVYLVLADGTKLERAVQKLIFLMHS